MEIEDPGLQGGMSMKELGILTSILTAVQMSVSNLLFEASYYSWRGTEWACSIPDFL